MGVLLNDGDYCVICRPRGLDLIRTAMNPVNIFWKNKIAWSQTKKSAFCCFFSQAAQLTAGFCVVVEMLNHVWWKISKFSPVHCNSRTKSVMSDVNVKFWIAILNPLMIMPDCTKKSKQLFLMKSCLIFLSELLCKWLFFKVTKSFEKKDHCLSSYT